MSLDKIEPQTLDSYIDLAKKTISKFGFKISHGLSQRMLKNEDAIADVAHSIMVADWKYDHSRVGKITGQAKTKYSYRNQCAIWAIKTYATRVYSKKSIKSLDDIFFDSKERKATVEDKRVEMPLDKIIHDEKQELGIELIGLIFKSNILTENQKSQIKMYYIEGLTLSEIGKKFNITREAIRQSIKSGIKKIQESLL